MDDYIKRSDVLALQTELKFEQIEQLKHYRCRHIDPISVKILPAADVRENVRGEWIPDEEDIKYGSSLVKYYCSRCGERAFFNRYEWKFIKSNFCPNCGADMRGEKK